MAEVSLRFALPAEPLRPFVSTYYTMSIRGEGLVRDMLHPEWANIRMRLNSPWRYGNRLDEMVDLDYAAMIHGPTSHATYIEGSAGDIFGIGILPTGWSRFWNADAGKFANRFPPLSELIGQAATQAFEQSILEAPDFEAQAATADAFLLALLAKRRSSMFDDQVSELFQVLIDPANATVEQITATLGLPQARLARLSKRGFGFPPKLLLRRQRFLRMLGTLHARPYEEWPDFIDPQYVDQSHMIRDFQYFLGMSPGQYFALPRPILSAAAKGRAAFMGQPLQGLHLPRKGTD